MKQNYILGLMLVFSAGALSQPILTQSNNAYIVGEVFNIGITSWDGTIPASGASQVWDYSDIVPETPYTYIALAPVDCDEYESFPGANIGTTNGGGNFEFHEFNVDEHLNIGRIEGDAVIPYSNPEQLIAYPFTFEDAFEDDYFATFERYGVLSEREGTISVSAIGYGSLMLSFRKIDNVLLIKYVRDYVDREEGEEIFHYLSEHYAFMIPNYHTPLLSFTRLEIEGITESFFGSITTNESVSIPTNDNFSGLKIYPNPVNDKLNIQLKAEQISSINSVEIVNITGAVVYQSSSFTVNVDTDMLAPGIYYLKLNTEEGQQVVRKFVKAY